MTIRDLETELLGLAGHIAAAQCRFLQLLAEFDRRGGWAGPGLRSCAHWLSWRAGMSLRTATEHLRVAHALARLPRISAAFAAGRVSYSKVRAITRITDDTGDGDPAVAEDALLNLALSGTASHVETVVRAHRRRRTPPADLTARRGVSWYWDEDGCLVLRARFTPADGAALVAAIDAQVPAPDPRKVDEPDPGATVDNKAARRADALLALVTGEVADEAAPVVARGRAQVIVHLDVDTGQARIHGGPEIAAGTAARLACDARAQVLLDDRTRNRLYLGRSRRLASPAQVAALVARDGPRCQFPGCTHIRYLQAHHVRSWLHGGRTDVDNLILTCSYHHGVIHDHGYRICRLPYGWDFRRADGAAVPATGAALTGDTENLIDIAARRGLRITHDPLTPNWGGERLDPGPILDALLPRGVKAAA